MTDLFFIIFQLCWICQLGFLLIFVYRLVFYSDRQSSDSSNCAPVSVIICAHNEEANLLQNLPSILKQEYPEYEVIVVDDASTDGSMYCLREAMLKYPHLRVLTIPVAEKKHGGKKQALEYGIREAKYPILLLTDADCRAASPYWISLISSKFSEGIEVVLGYSPAVDEERVLNALVRYDALFTAVQYLGAALSGWPYMGTGRNLAYKRHLALSDRTKKHLELLSGDDDLFINQVANRKNTAICINRKAHMLTYPKESWGGFFRQKVRHASTGFRYTFKHITMLGLWNGSKLLFYVSLIFVLWSKNNTFGLPATLTIVYVLLNWLAFFKLTKRLSDRDLLLFIPILDVVSVFFNSFVLATAFFSKRNQWN